MTSRLVVTVSPDVGGRWRWKVRLDRPVSVRGEELTGTSVDEYAAWATVGVHVDRLVGDAAVAAAGEEGE